MPSDEKNGRYRRILNICGSRAPVFMSLNLGQTQTQRCPAAAAGWNMGGCQRAGNKSKASAQEPYLQGGQEGTDKGFHYLKGRERDTCRTNRNTNH